MNSTNLLNSVINELASNLSAINSNSTHNDHTDHSHQNHSYYHPSHYAITKDSIGHYHNEDEDDDNDRDSQYNTIIAKATAMTVLFCASTLCGCIPFILNRRFKWTENNTNARSAIVVKCLLYFGGGVLLCTTFLHLLPEVKENIEGLQSKHILPHFSFNFAELLMCLGFFAMFLVEELIHTYIHKHNKNAQNATGAFVRGISITESILVKRKSNSSSKSSTSSSSTTGESIKDTDTTTELINRKNKNEKHTSEEKQNDNNVVNTNDERIVITPSAQDNDGGITNNGFEHENKNKIANEEIIDKEKTSGGYYKKNLQNTQQHPDLQEKSDHHNKLHHQHEEKHHTHRPHNHHHEEHGNHGHSHLPIGTLEGNLNEDQIVASLRGLLVVLALSVHELFEGLAVGLESRTANVWYMFGAVSAHKLVLAFCVGVELIVTRTKLWLAIIYVITFAIVSPIGIGIGILVSSSDNGSASAIPSAVLQGLATGTLLYVVFFEILSKERSGLIPYASFVVGFAVMFGLQFATGHEHSHDHGHGHDHGHSHDSLEHRNNSSADDEIDYTKKTLQEQIEILRAAGKELLERNQYYQQHQHQHQD